MDLQQRIAANLQRVRSEIADAAARSGGSGDRVRLVAVTKAVGLDEIAALIALGQTDLGENRAEQLMPRAREVAEVGLGVTWHMIGHLQRRKVRDLLPVVAMIHGVDSLRLAAEIDKRAAAADLLPVPALLEVNVSGEGQKYGFRPDEVEEALRNAAPMEPESEKSRRDLTPVS